MPPQHYASETTPGLWLHQNTLAFSRPKGGDIYDLDENMYIFSLESLW